MRSHNLKKFYYRLQEKALALKRLNIDSCAFRTFRRYIPYEHSFPKLCLPLTCIRYDAGVVSLPFKVPAANSVTEATRSQFSSCLVTSSKRNTKIWDADILHVLYV